MAAFSSFSACETRAKAKVADGTWIYGHAQRTFSGVLSVRVVRKMSPTNPGHGAWVEITDDGTV